MRLYHVLFVSLLPFLSVVRAFATDPKPAERPPIREFDVATLSRLGRAIYQHDQLAWKATDVVMGQIGLARLRRDGGRGWIVDTSRPDEPVVHWLRNGDHGLEILCDVVFPAKGSPEIRVPSDRTLPPPQRLVAEALETAKARFATAKLPWCGGNPNAVVLDDPDGSGFLVYFLRASPSADEVPIGGHYRFTVSADAKTVEQIDQLFASCLTMSKKVPDGGKLEVLVVSHVISPTPLETQVFLSLQESLPFAVIAPDGMIWYIDKGEMGRYANLDELKKKSPPEAKKPAKKKK